MAINRDISDLPTPAQEGDPPRRPRIVTRLAEKWVEQFGNEFADVAIPEAGPYRMSWASTRCDRALQYKLAGVEMSNPPDLGSVYRMNIGTMLHRAFQGVMADTFGDDWEDEIVVDLRPLGIPGSGRIDGAQHLDVGWVPVELKSINGFGFKMAATTRSRTHRKDHGRVTACSWRSPSWRSTHRTACSATCRWRTSARTRTNG